MLGSGRILCFIKFSVLCLLFFSFFHFSGFSSFQFFKKSIFYVFVLFIFQNVVFKKRSVPKVFTSVTKVFTVPTLFSVPTFFRSKKVGKKFLVKT